MSDAVRAPELDEYRKHITKIDRLLLELLAKRMNVAKDIEAVKRRDRQVIVDEMREETILKDFGDLAAGTYKPLTADFARSILYFLINESCKIQLVQRQRADERAAAGLPETDAEPPDEIERHQWYKRNLLALTAKTAPGYPEAYEKGYYATHAYLDFEGKKLAEASRDGGDLALDLGCATGRIAAKLADLGFATVIGYDISSDMIDEAKRRYAGVQRVRFEKLDVEDGLPHGDGTVSLIVLNMGTASDIVEIRGVLGEIKRVLKPGGRVFLSFYNAGALYYQCGFMPWEVALAATVNVIRSRLEVHFGGELFKLYAKPYRVGEVAFLLSEYLQVEPLLTYPTISSILPRESLPQDVFEAVAEIDETLAPKEDGAYIIAIGVKAS